MKVFSSTCEFDYSWDEVSTANWRKYCPWNDKATHVVGVDTLSRTIDPQTGIVSGIMRTYTGLWTDLFSCEPNVSLLATSRYPSGFFRSLAVVPPPTCTKFPTSIPLLRRSPCAPPILLGRMCSTSARRLCTSHHRFIPTPRLNSAKKRRSPLSAVGGRRSRTRSRRLAWSDSGKTPRAAAKGLKPSSK